MVLVVAVAVTATLLAWRERPEPGATTLTVLLGGQVWWSVFYIFQLEATSLSTKLLWTNVQWLGVVVTPVAWLLFSLTYTGNDQYLTRRNVVGLAVIPVITVLLAATDPYHALLHSDARLVGTGQSVRLAVEGGPWFWVIAAYTYLLALLIGTLAPWVSNIFYLTGNVPIPGFDPTPVAFAVSGVAYLGAFTRFRLLGTSPAPNRRARHLVFERLHDGAVVVDSHGYIVDLNDSAVSIFSTSYRRAVGTPADEVVPDYDRLPALGSMEGHLSIGAGHQSRPYDVTVTEITDFRERQLGRVITFHDIGDYLRQQQRLEVLNRVLRHNIRTETNLIQGYADLLETPENTETVATIKQHTREIVEVSDKSRAITELFREQQNGTDVVDLDDLLGECIETLGRSHPDVDVEYDSPDEHVGVDSVLEAVCWNVIENAAVHNTNDDPWVRIDVESDDSAVQISVADNGPGIDEYEQAVITEGTETPLKHGSGLGLWLIVWGAELADGSVQFENVEPTGSVVTLRVPRQ